MSIFVVLLGTSFIKDPERRSHSLGAREKEEEEKKKEGRRRKKEGRERGREKGRGGGRPEPLGLSLIHI